MLNEGALEAVSGPKSPEWKLVHADGIQLLLSRQMLLSNTPALWAIQHTGSLGHTTALEQKNALEQHTGSLGHTTALKQPTALGQHTGSLGHTTALEQTRKCSLGNTNGI